MFVPGRDFVLIGGGVGQDGLTTVAEVFDFKTNSFTALAGDHLKLESPTAAVLNDAVPLVCGKINGAAPFSRLSLIRLSFSPLNNFNYTNQFTLLDIRT